jgi:RING finger and CHY zinc finger domain-containing protein 1
MASTSSTSSSSPSPSPDLSEEGEEQEEDSSREFESCCSEKDEGGLVGVDQEGSESRHGCKHYVRSCELLCPVCEAYYTCRLCHDDDVLSHELPRHEVKMIRCLCCGRSQAPSSSCENSECGVIFARYHCSVCNLYDDSNRTLYHCTECGICRVGVREENMHCEKCAICVPLDHVCHDQNRSFFLGCCPCCHEDIFNSVRPSAQLQCSHVIHTHCLKEMLRASLYQCPLCRSSMVDMSAAWSLIRASIARQELPPELQRTATVVCCEYGCGKKSEVPWHPEGSACSFCGSFNTLEQDQ